MFEWDPRKAARNLRKHRVSFEEAATVFADLASVERIDEDHSENELRFLRIGWSTAGRLLIVGYTERGTIDAPKIHIITARPASPKEHADY